MAYRKTDAEAIKGKLFINVYEASILTGLGREKIREMAKNDLDMSTGFFAIQAGKKILLNRAKFIEYLESARGRLF